MFDCRLAIADWPKNEIRNSRAGGRISIFQFRVSALRVNRQARESRAGKRVDGSQALKPAEVAVSGDELRNSVLEAESNDVSVVNQISDCACLAKGLVEDRSVSFRFGEQKERRRGQYLFQILQSNVQRNRRMKDSGMSDNSEELVDAGPGNRPGQRPFRQPLEELERGAVALARLNFSMDEDVRVDGLHGLAPIHEIEQGVTVQQVHTGLFSRLPAPKAQLVGFRRAGGQGAPKKVVRHRLQGAALCGGFPLQLAEKLIVNRQSGSSHMQKHMVSASKCQPGMIVDLRLPIVDSLARTETRNWKIETRGSAADSRVSKFVSRSIANRQSKIGN